MDACPKPQACDYPGTGGQQQRVAIARALVVSPKVFLLDEPLSNLDARLRHDVRQEIRGLQQRLGLTTLMVTHDQEEALTMADRMIVMEGGRVRQVGTPTCLVAERHWDQVAWAVAEYAWCFQPVIDEVRA